jgi:hypothetical protein
MDRPLSLKNLSDMPQEAHSLLSSPDSLVLEIRTLLSKNFQSVPQRFHIGSWSLSQPVHLQDIFLDTARFFLNHPDFRQNMLLIKARDSDLTGTSGSSIPLVPALHAIAVLGPMI